MVFAVFTFVVDKRRDSFDGLIIFYNINRVLVSLHRMGAGKEGNQRAVEPSAGSAVAVWGRLAALHGAVALFGVAGLFGKWLPLNPLLIVFGRVLVASLAFAVVLRFLRLERRRAGPGERILFTAGGALLAFHWVAFFQAIQRSTVAVGLLSYSVAPVAVVLLEPLWFRERLSGRALGAAGLCAAGVALIVPRWEAGQAVLQGAAWGVAAGLSFAVLSLLNRQLVQRHHSIHIAFWQDAVALAVLLPFLPRVWQTPTLPEAGLLLVLGVFCTAIAHTLYIHAMTRIKARVAAITSALEPVYGIGLALLLLDEVPTARTLGGGTLILGAVLWVSLRAGRGE
jgi:drug/metabolite transporter (DMT)-like permease